MPGFARKFNSNELQSAIDAKLKSANNAHCQRCKVEKLHIAKPKACTKLLYCTKVINYTGKVAKCYSQSQKVTNCQSSYICTSDGANHRSHQITFNGMLIEFQKVNYTSETSGLSNVVTNNWLSGIACKESGYM